MRARRRLNRTMVEINITPFTDIVLVLLIIFMVATPLIMGGSIKVDLPGAKKTARAGDAPGNVKVTVDPAGDVYIDNARFDIKADPQKITERLMEVARGGAEASLVVYGDKNCKFDHIIRIIDMANQAGIKKTFLQIEPRR
jgi:biopolymer transport protein TolR